MKKDWSHLERNRIIEGPLASEPQSHCGAFRIPVEGHNQNTQALIIADSGEISGWEHVTVRVGYRVNKVLVRERQPNWQELCAVKDLFWDADEVVVQFQRAREDCEMHLWRRRFEPFTLPPIGLFEPLKQ